MKIKTLLLLIMILIFVGIAGGIVLKKKSADTPEDRLGKTLLPGFPVNEVTTVVLNHGKEWVSLKKKDERWVVESRYDYYADFSKISDLLRKIHSLKVGRQFEAKEETVARLFPKQGAGTLSPEESAGMRVELQKGERVTLVSLHLGKVRRPDPERGVPSGQYVMLDDKKQIYLVDQDFQSIKPIPANWLEKTLVEIKSDQIRKVTCRKKEDNKVLYTLLRQSGDKPLELSDPPDGTKVNAMAVNRLINAVRNLKMTDVEGPFKKSKDSRNFPVEIAFELFNGMTYRLYFAKSCPSKEQCRLKISAGYSKPPSKGREGPETNASDKAPISPAKSPEEYALEAQQINARIEPWVYLIAEWQKEAFPLGLDPLLEKPAPSEAKNGG
jgi:hypothetical protein